MSNLITIQYLLENGFKSEDGHQDSLFTLKNIEVYIPSDDHIEVSVKSDDNPNNYETNIPCCNTEKDLQDLMRLMGIKPTEG